MENIQQDILNATLVLFNDRGLDFTMNDIAKSMHIAKKTIYRFFSSKEELLIALLDYGFENIQKEKQKILSSNDSIAKRLEQAMIAMPKQYAKIDFRMLVSLRDVYPEAYVRLNEHLENDWEPIIKLINEGIRKKEIRKINTFILRQIVTATFEQLLSTDQLQERNLSYAKALKEMMNIIMKGIVVDND